MLKLRNHFGWHWSYILIHLLTHMLLFSSHLAMFAIIVTMFIVIHDKLYTILNYMRTYYCELWQLGFKMDNLDGYKMFYLRTNYCNPWQSKYKIQYYMEKNTTLSKQFSNPIKKIVERGKIDDPNTHLTFLAW
jgi:hypothetical protein